MKHLKSDKDLLGLEDLMAKGVILPEDVESVENFTYDASDFEGTEMTIDGEAPGILIKTREGLFRAFYIEPFVVDYEYKDFFVYEGGGVTPEEAKRQAMKEVIEASRVMVSAINKWIESVRKLAEEEDENGNDVPQA